MRFGKQNKTWAAFGRKLFGEGSPSAPECPVEEGTDCAVEAPVEDTREGVPRPDGSSRSFAPSGGDASADDSDDGISNGI